MKSNYKFKLSLSELPALTKEQQAFPYSDLYYRDIAEPDDAIMNAYAPEHPIDPSLAIMPEDLVKFITPSFLPTNGYCVLPNGVGYCCAVVNLPGANLQMFDYRLKLVFSEDMGFIVEYPGFHKEHYNGLCIEDSFDGPKALILDRNYSAYELGFSDLPNHLNPEIVGFSAHEQDFIATEGPIDPTRGKGVLILITKKIPGGLQHIWIIYQGIHICNQKSVVVLSDDEVITQEQCRRIGLHLAYESVNQNQYLPILMKRFPNRTFGNERPWPDKYLFLKH